MIVTPNYRNEVVWTPLLGLVFIYIYILGSFPTTLRITWKRTLGVGKDRLQNSEPLKTRGRGRDQSHGGSWDAREAEVGNNRTGADFLGSRRKRRVLEREERRKKRRDFGDLGREFSGRYRLQEVSGLPGSKLFWGLLENKFFQLQREISQGLLLCFWKNPWISPPSCNPMDETRKWVSNHCFSCL